MTKTPEKPEKEPLTGLALLRAPFPPNQISKLPKPTRKQTDEVSANSKAGIRCKICGGWHHKDAVHLDYVGHAALTDRLLEADPNWNWEPLARDESGLPLVDRDGGMWINLTVCGITRMGYGDAAGKKGPDATKERIGDALRNAAMRFGCALDLWHKGDLHAVVEVADDDEEKDSDDKTDDTPEFDPNGAKQRIAGELKRCETLKDLAATWLKNAETIREIKAADKALSAQLSNLKDKLKVELDQAAVIANLQKQIDEEGREKIDDEIPY